MSNFDASLLTPNFEPAEYIKPLFNVGAGLDIPTGYYINGRHGESILNGGVGYMTALVGRGNSFKSTIIHYMALSAMNNIFSSLSTTLMTYDTEVNMHETQLQRFVNNFEYLSDKDIFRNGIWRISDKINYSAEKWWEEFKEYIKNKIKNKDKLTLETPFIDRDGVSLYKMIVPTFCQIDSFSELETSDVIKIQDENELGDSGGNTIHMRQGLAKTRIFMELPRILSSSKNFLFITAHVGQDNTIQSGPIALPPPKKISTMKSGDKIKGVTDKFFFHMSNAWQSMKSDPLINQTTKGAEYPIDPSLQESGDVDLYCVSLKLLRSKSAQSGSSIDLIVSQREGVLPSLTEFHLIKTMDRFGLSGNNVNFHLDLMPDVNLTRPTIRSKLANDAKLRRALTITSELAQITRLWKNTPKELLCTPKELYDDIKNKGYDWDILLNTRGWWTFNNDKHPIPYLSTMDLLNMRLGLYKPYWLK